MRKIYAEFLNKHGGDSQRKSALNVGLEKNKEYELEKAKVGRFCSYIKLKGFEKWFNSVMFYFKVEDKEITDFIKLMYEPEFEKLRDKEEELYMGSITIIDGGGKPPFGSEGFIKHS